MDWGAIEALDPVDRRRAAERALLKKSFLDFVRWAFGVTHAHGRRLIEGWYLPVVCAHAQAFGEAILRRAGRSSGFEVAIDRLVASLPPGHLKSEVFSVYLPAWVWVHWPACRFLVSGVDPDVVKRDSRVCRELVTSDAYRDMFGADWIVLPSQEAKGYWVMSTGGARISKSVGSEVTGTKVDAGIVDDPLGEKDAREGRAALTEHVWWYRNVFRGRLVSGAPRCVVMHRLHEHDLAGTLAEKDRWESLVIRAEHDPDDPVPTTALGWTDPRTEPGELLAGPLDPEEFAELKEDDPYMVEAKYNHRPRSPTGSLFRAGWFDQRWRPNDLPEGRRVVSIDTNNRDGRSNSYFVAQIWLIAWPNLYLLDQVRERADPPRQFGICAEIAAAHKPRAWLVEARANGKKLSAQLKRRFAGVLEYEPQGESKYQRASSTTPIWQAGQIWLPPRVRGFHWVDDLFVPEFLKFPGPFDDQVDAASQLILTVWMEATKARRKRRFGAPAPA